MNPIIQLQIERQPAQFQPGEILSGEVAWSGASGITSATINLFWTTSGKGSKDTAVVTSQRLEHVREKDERRFDFPLPDSPSSFSGSLITLTWGVEVLLNPGEAAAHAEFVLAPDGKELRLAKITPDKSMKKPWWRPG